MGLYWKAPDDAEQKVREDAFRAATKGLPDAIVATAMNCFSLGINWTGSTKKSMREEFVRCGYATNTKHARKPTIRELCLFLLRGVEKQVYGVRSERTKKICKRQAVVIRQILDAQPPRPG